MTRFLRRIYCCRWIFSCSGVALRPDSPVPPSVWVIRDYIQQDALLSQGREPEGSGGGRAFLQRRPREAFLWPPRDWPWQLRRCLLCTAHHTLCQTQSLQRKQTRFSQHVNKMRRGIKCTGAVESFLQCNGGADAVNCCQFYLYLITCPVDAVNNTATPNLLNFPSESILNRFQHISNLAEILSRLFDPLEEETSVLPETESICWGLRLVYRFQCVPSVMVLTIYVLIICLPRHGTCAQMKWWRLRRCPTVANSLMRWDNTDSAAHCSWRWH